MKKLLIEILQELKSINKKLQAIESSEEQELYLINSKASKSELNDFINFVNNKLG
ncbi:hypothetical protein HED38_02865 [Vagococcus fluvialis]|nr:hypothetical protein [Vagococcus fluvialis]